MWKTVKCLVLWEKPLSNDQTYSAYLHPQWMPCFKHYRGACSNYGWGTLRNVMYLLVRVPLTASICSCRRWWKIDELILCIIAIWMHRRVTRWRYWATTSNHKLKHSYFRPGGACYQPIQKVYPIYIHPPINPVLKTQTRKNTNWLSGDNFMIS